MLKARRGLFGFPTSGDVGAPAGFGVVHTFDLRYRPVVPSAEDVAPPESPISPEGAEMRLQRNELIRAMRRLDVQAPPPRAASALHVPSSRGTALPNDIAARAPRVAVIPPPPPGLR